MKARIGINPVAAVSGLLLSLMLAACGGGGGGGAGGGGGGGGTGGGGGQQMNITPGGNFYGALDWGSRGQYCDSGWAVGVATGYASRAAARAAAIRQCRSEGGTDCGPDVTEFGSAYSRGNQCVASAFGRNPSGGCGLRTRKGRTSSAAESAALAECRSDGFSCRIVTTACSTSGPAASYSRRASGGSGGPGDGGTPPVVTQPVTPPAGGGNRSYGEFVFSARSGDCSDGYALGVATGHSTVNGARAAARNRCESAGGRSCGSGFRQFGSAYSGGNQCAAVAHGWNPSTRLCHLRSGNGSGTAAAESAALSACRAGGYSCAVAASACSTSGVESSDQGTGSFNGGGAPTVVTPPVATPPSVGNRRPVVAGGVPPRDGPAGAHRKLVDIRGIQRSGRRPADLRGVVQRPGHRDRPVFRGTRVRHGRSGLHGHGQDHRHRHRPRQAHGDNDVFRAGHRGVHYGQPRRRRKPVGGHRRGRRQRLCPAELYKPGRGMDLGPFEPRIGPERRGPGVPERRGHALRRGCLVGKRLRRLRRGPKVRRRLVIGLQHGSRGAVQGIGRMRFTNHGLPGVCNRLHPKFPMTARPGGPSDRGAET